VLTLPPSLKIFVATAPVHGRDSFDGLSSRVHAPLGQDPLSRHLFDLLNRRRTQVRVLFFDRTGLPAGTDRLGLTRARKRGAIVAGGCANGGSCVRPPVTEVSALGE
jgi:transposase